MCSLTDEPTVKRHFAKQYIDERRCKEKIVDNHALRHDVMFLLLYIQKCTLEIYSRL